MTTKFSGIFKINGVIDTNKPVKQNMDTIASAASSWVTFDIHTGKWSIVINQAGPSVASFNDSNIIGSITASGTGLTELYNKVELKFPNKDLGDEIDTVVYAIPEEDRFPNEPDNTLNIEYDIVNNLVQAKALAVRELKQSRVDKIVQFRTDFSMLGLAAGDLIDITSSMYGWTAKKFRIITIAEEDAEDNTIVLSITALEYDANIYNDGDVVMEQREEDSGVKTFQANSDLVNKDYEGFASKFNNFNHIYYFETADNIVIAETPTSTTDFSFATEFDNSQDQYLLGKYTTLPRSGRYKVTYYIEWSASVARNSSNNFVTPDFIRTTCAIILNIDGERRRIAEFFNRKSSMTAISVLGKSFYGSAGQRVDFNLMARSEFGPNHPDSGGYSSAFSFVLVRGELQYLGPN